MDTSILLAQILGPFIVLIGIGVIFNTKIFQQIAQDFIKNPALIYFSGLVTFLGGLAIVLFHNIWAADWRVIITIFGWLTLLKGIWLVALPVSAVQFSGKFIKNIKYIAIPWAIMLLVGLFLISKGYAIGYCMLPR